MYMLRRIISGVSAGLLVSIGGCVFLALANDIQTKFVGAVLFAVALLVICFRGYSLFTGKVGFMVDDYSKNAWSVLLLGLLGNAIGTVAMGIAVKYAIPALSATAKVACEARLEQSLGQAIIRGMLCGVLMYLAVVIYRSKNTISGIIYCIPVFILSGFEHSVADMFYFAASGIVNVDVFVFVAVIILSNGLGAIMMALLERYGKEVPKDAK